MSENPLNRVRWSGASSVAEVEATLDRCGQVEIQLPPDFHHALFSRLNPDARTTRLEHIDLTDGVDLLRKVAGIRGLQELGNLEPRVRDRRATVHLLSPVPLLVLSLPKEHARTP